MWEVTCTVIDLFFIFRWAAMKLQPSFRNKNEDIL